MNKKILSLFLALSLLLLPISLIGCANEPSRDGELDIVVTVFPIYDWVKNLLGEAAEGASITLLLDNGVDLHSYQPTFEDIERIAGCDLFVYIGGESDAWVDEVLKVSAAPNRRVLNLMEVLGDKLLYEEHDHEDGDAEHGHGEEADEHIWLSLKRAGILCEAISEELTALDAAHALQYETALSEYRARILALDLRYEEAIAAASKDTLIFADRFPFRYLTDDYGLNYHAAFSGCSTETNATPQTIISLAERVDALDLHYVLKLEGSTHKTPETVVASTRSGDREILSLHSLQSVSRAEIADGASYLLIMENNLAVIRTALS